MAIITVALANLLIVVAIGIVAGLLFNRYGQTWFRRQFNTSHTDITSALVGIAGSFIGFHIVVRPAAFTTDALHLRRDRRCDSVVAMARSVACYHCCSVPCTDTRTPPVSRAQEVPTSAQGQQHAWDAPGQHGRFTPFNRHSSVRRGAANSCQEQSFSEPSSLKCHR